MKKNIQNKKSPYTSFKEWLYNSHPDAILEESVKKAINPRSVLMMLGNLGGLTIFLNNYFNNYGIFKLDDMEFYQFIKQLIKKYNIKQNEFSFFKGTENNKSIKELHKFFPTLKQKELSWLLDLAKDDDEYDNLLESIGLKKYKNEKVKKEKIKKTKESKELAHSSEITPKTIPIDDPNLITTMEQLREICFSTATLNDII